MHTTVREIMTRTVVTARPEMPVSEAVALLNRHNIRSMPVCDGTGRVVGMISQTDLFLREKGVPFSQERAPSLLGEYVGRQEIDHCRHARLVKVGDVMSRHLTTVTERDAVEDVALLMHGRRLHCLPVMAGEELRGVVSRIDVLTAIYGACDVAAPEPVDLEPALA